MQSKTYSATQKGIDGVLIEVEASLQNALPHIQITGLPDSVVKESRDRIQACLTSMGHMLPSGRITLHLSPAEVPKQGSHNDLAMALAILAAEGHLPKQALEEIGVLGELSLDGRVREISSSLILLDALEKNPKIKKILIPKGNEADAALIESRKALLVSRIEDCVEYLFERKELATPVSKPEVPEIYFPQHSLDHVVGQWIAKRALQISLAGSHHLLLIGSPGVGKSLIASCTPTLQHALSPEERINLHKIYSCSGVSEAFDGKRPFRAPHHTISTVGLLGGGSGRVIPGEVTLAHSGVLFLDEFPEFRRDALESLREPLQNGVIHLHRSGDSQSLPANFTLIAAMNPCPCGHSLSLERRCYCTQDKLTSYRKRLSGPIMDRMDLCVVLSTPKEGLSEAFPLSEIVVKESVEKVREIQLKRNQERGAARGSLLNIRESCFALDCESETWLKDHALSRALSFRAIHKMIRVARTIADLGNEPSIRLSHLQEAWGLRCVDLQNPYGMR